MLPPPPEVSLLNTEAAFRAVEGEDEDVEAARESAALQHSELLGLYAEVCPGASLNPAYAAERLLQALASLLSSNK